MCFTYSFSYVQLLLQRLLISMTVLTFDTVVQNSSIGERPNQLWRWCSQEIVWHPTFFLPKILPCIVCCSNLYLVPCEMCAKNSSFLILTVNRIYNYFSVNTMLFVTWSVREIFNTHVNIRNYEETRSLQNVVQIYRTVWL